MSGDPIGPAMRNRIEVALAAIEREHGVRVLLAIESGSRAWGFPSRDSDYDVRFLYQRSIEDYLTVVPKRDVIEKPIDTVLDVSGWDVRKALLLLLRSNAALLEWLTSPVRYRDGGATPGRLLELARATADRTALAWHYHHQARRAYAEIVAGEGEVRFKTYCYALRPALALLWLRSRGEPPPMDVPSLMAGLDPSRDVSDAVADLIARKAEGTEKGTTERIPVLDRWIGDALAVPVQAADAVERSRVAVQVNTLFASIVLGGIG